MELNHFSLTIIIIIIIIIIISYIFTEIGLKLTMFSGDILVLISWSMRVVENH